MSTELKSSDEILQELFGMCSKTKKSIHSSSESSHSKSDVEDDASTKKHKKKKKKHKKLKKRGRSSSDESDSNEHKTHKRKKKKSHKDEDKSKKLKIKIKTEPGEPEEPVNSLDGIEKKDNLMDTATGRKLTIDDVFQSLGIVKTEKIKIEKGLSPVKTNEKNGCAEKQTNDSKEVILPAPPNSTSNDKIQLKVEKQPTSDQSNSTKTKLNDVFDTEPNQLAEKNKAKKINIDNLKNSCVYEATIKEIEERERKKAEKYEEGELSSSSNSSQNNMSDDEATETANGTESQKKEKKRHKHKHRSKSKSHERSRSKHRSRSHHSKHSHEKTSHKSHRSDKSSVSPPRHSRSSKSYHDHHHHYSVHHRSYYSYYSRASSVEDRGSPRSRRSRDERRGKSSDRSHSRTRSKVTSKERKSRSKSIEKIDKQKLLEIARKNAITLLKQGALPASVVVNKEKITSIKAGGKTVDELTDFCKQLSKKEAEGQESLSSGSELDEEREKAFHHPFQLKERPSSIVMNIRNAVSLPTKTAQEKTLELSKQLSLQYPVSSGQQHRTTESEWVPVEKTPDPVPAPVMPPPPAPIAPVAAPVTIQANQPYHALEHPPLVAYPPINFNGYSNQIPLPPTPNNDIGSIVAERLEAIRRLTENPADPIGNNLIQVADTKMKVWAESKVQPGLFTGTTGVRTLSAAELSSGFKAWPKKNQFIVAKPVVSDKGEALMKKMGWQPGEGLGKYKQGPPEPCEISMKTDRKGLAEQTVSFQQNNPTKRAFELSQNKHPVSLLNEFCSRKKIGTPSYDCEEKEGAGKRKLFLFSVTVKGMKYTPQMPCCNKKQSKIEAATLCLQNLGLLPSS